MIKAKSVRLQRLWARWSGWLVGSLMLVLPSQAQQVADAPPVDLHDSFAGGRADFEAHHYEEAARHFGEVFTAQTHFFIADQGSAAYWLGRAHEAAGDAARAVTIWQAGLGALDMAGLFDVRLADAYVRSVFAEKRTRDYARAGAVYLDLLARLDTDLSEQEHTGLDRHVAQMIFLLSDDLRAQIIDQGSSWIVEGWRVKEGASEALLRWWRSRDPLPGTRRNERLEEHLQRVAYATQAYRYDRGRAGFDDRGEIYVRFGEPARKRNLSHNKALEYMFVAYAPVTASDLLDNEFWLYHDIAEEAYYLFARRQGRYRISEVYDLIPKRLRYVKPPSNDAKLAQRDLVRARALLEIMRDYYRQLAWAHSDFFPRFMDLDDYLLMADEAAQEGDQLFAARHGSLDAFGMQMIGKGRMQDAEAVYLRELFVPKERSTVLDEVEPLNVAVRLARFLDVDGTTRTEIFWSHAPGAFALPAPVQERYKDQYDTRRFLMQMTAVQHLGDYQERALTRYRYLADDHPTTSDSSFQVQALVLRGDTARQYHLGLQWDQHLTTVQQADAGQAVAGPRVKVGSYRADSLAALNPSPGALEMSDLAPVLLSKDTFDELSRYPWAVISPETPIGLYFEIYDLRYGADDQTHYTVEYEIVRLRQDKGTLLRFLGRGDEERTSVATSYTGTSRKRNESIALDLSEWAGEGEIEIRVHVRDDTSGQQVERSVFFVLHPAAERE